MRDIEDAIKERTLSTAATTFNRPLALQEARLKKQLKEAKASDKEIEQKLFQLRWKEFSCNFKSCSRERRIEIFANKTNPPPMGHYRPKKAFVETSSR